MACGSHREGIHYKMITSRFGPWTIWPLDNLANRQSIWPSQSVDLAHLIYFGFAIYLYFLLSINSRRWYLSHVPSTFATVNMYANVFFVFLPGGISKEWRHIVSANCEFKGNLPGQYRVFTSLLGNTWAGQK